MTRQRTRPYECVRRVWHSERHQALRGSIIQELFRVACEIHGEGTRKNKEWQEKLPCVVIRVEEILYSEAQSEAEYTNLETLVTRTNDAIDIIIRRDQTVETETGNLLEPCIEAALVVGCLPMRVSRSQRDIIPLFSLSSIKAPDPSSAMAGSVVYPFCNLMPSDQVTGSKTRDNGDHGDYNVGDELSKLASSLCATGLDLSLRLGLPSLGGEALQEVCSSSSGDGSRCCDLNCPPASPDD